MQEPEPRGGFAAVDDAEDPNAFVAYLEEADRIPLIVELRRRIAERVSAQPGEAVVDVGCGSGAVLEELAARVGESGRVVGVDASEQMLAAARKRVPDWVELVRADAARLPLPDSSFDAYRAERVYQHLADAASALAEAHRVLKAGGRIVVVDPDWEALVLDVDDRETFRCALDASLAPRPGATVGRRLWRLLHEAGFRDVEVDVSSSALTDFERVDRMLLSGLVFTEAAAAAVGDANLARLHQELENRAKQGQFFASVPMFIACGRV